jgi:hypothetical protein
VPIEWLQALLGRPRRAESLHASLGPEADPVDPGTVKAVADLLGKLYADEEDRRKSLDTKTATLLGADGVLIGLSLGTLTKPPDALANATTLPVPWAGTALAVAEIVYFGALVVALACLLVADVLFVESLRVKQYGRPPLMPWFTASTAALTAEALFGRLAATYRDAISLNTTLNDRKVTRQEQGLWWFFAGLACLLLIGLCVAFASVLTIWLTFP